MRDTERHARIDQYGEGVQLLKAAVATVPAASEAVAAAGGRLVGPRDRLSLRGLRNEFRLAHPVPDRRARSHARQLRSGPLGG